jgi:hypothetical protein
MTPSGTKSERIRCESSTKESEAQDVCQSEGSWGMCVGM